MGSGANDIRAIDELLAGQAQLNAALDLDKNEMQVAPPAEDTMTIVAESVPEPVSLSKPQRSSFPAMSP